MSEHIVIIGGNFAGLTAAVKLSKRHAVTVIDPSAHFEWMPNIHEILSSVKTPQGLRLDRAAVVEQAGHRFLQDRVTELHPAAQRLLTAGGRPSRMTADRHSILAALALRNRSEAGGDRQLSLANHCTSERPHLRIRFRKERSPRSAVAGCRRGYVDGGRGCR